MSEQKLSENIAKCWEQPQLVAIVRSRNEEHVLGACKIYDMGPGGPSNEAYACGQYIETICNPCSLTATS